MRKQREREREIEREIERAERHKEKRNMHTSHIHTNVHTNQQRSKQQSYTQPSHILRQGKHREEDLHCNVLARCSIRVPAAYSAMSSIFWPELPSNRVSPASIMQG